MNKIKGVNMKHITMTEARKLKLDKPQKYFKLAADVAKSATCTRAKCGSISVSADNI